MSDSQFLQTFTVLHFCMAWTPPRPHCGGKVLSDNGLHSYVISAALPRLKAVPDGTCYLVMPHTSP